MGMTSEKYQDLENMPSQPLKTLAFTLSETGKHGKILSR